jgi:FkbM family methyltransferase
MKINRIASFFARKLFNQFSSYSDLTYQEQDFWYKKIGFRKCFQLSSNDVEVVKIEGIDVSLRVLSSDFLVYRQVFLEDEYIAVTKLIELNSLNVRTMIDCGANIGFASLYFKLKYPMIKIFSLEPDSENFELLKKNTLWSSDISISKSAVWREDANLYESGAFRDSLPWSKQYSEIKTDRRKEVKSYSLKSIFYNSGFTHVDFLKMDIEGSEFEVFRNKENLDFLCKVFLFAIEIHPEMGDKEVLVSIFKEHDFLLFETKETILGVNKRRL